MSRARPALVPVCQRRFVAMMSVGNHEFFVRHFALDRLDVLRIRHRPQAVNDVVLVADFHLRLCRAGRIQQARRRARPDRCTA